MIKLGQKVEDTVSGLVGIAVARTEWLNGCIRISVQPKIDKDGNLPDNRDFDEPQLKIIEENPLKRGPSDTGGPMEYSPSQKATPSR